MSGRAKKIAYGVADGLLFACACAGYVLVNLSAIAQHAPKAEWLGAAALWCVSLCLRLPALVHECGHLLFGLLVGMRPISFSVRCVRFAKGERPRFVRSDFAGKTEMVPQGGGRMRGRTMFYTAGGAALDLLAGGALLAVFLALPQTNFGVLYAGSLMPFLFYEGVRALLPAQLPAGKTDGAVLCGLLKKTSEEEVMLRVFTAQGILYRGDFSDIARPLLFEAPVVREDLPAFSALLMLRLQYLLSEGKTAEAEEVYHRLSGLSEYFAPEEEEEVERYGGAFTGNFEKKPTPVRGIARLEALLEKQNKNSAVGQNGDLLK